MTNPAGSVRQAALLSWALIASLASAPLAAADWPWWRGPLGTGVSPEQALPLQWSEATLGWTVDLGGRGVSSPVVARGLVIVTSQQGVGARKPGVHPLLARLDPEVAEGERALGGGTAAEETGAGAGLEGEVVFLVEAFAAGDGRLQWRFELPAVGELPEVHEKHNLASPSPVVDGDTVYAWFGTGQLVALDLEGRLRWQRHLGEDVAPFEIDWGHGSSPA
ncbi:MAG: PQQ-binding-like beta-propeller repeat protein, partial [Thermoanaerobaculia bacterium]|nr:PQQ-binding-like beta-propeller repeat protein [Thermoanaerobaculia bacterium]